jgi:hypothetical protein
VNNEGIETQIIIINGHVNRSGLLERRVTNSKKGRG